TVDAKASRKSQVKDANLQRIARLCAININGPREHMPANTRWFGLHVFQDGNYFLSMLVEGKVIFCVKFLRIGSVNDGWIDCLSLNNIPVFHFVYRRHIGS